MTKLTATIRPAQLEAVKKALLAWGVAGLSVGEVKGFGTAGPEGAAGLGGFAPQLQVEVVVPTPLVPRLVDELCRAARTGKEGDGLVVVEAIDEAVRIRTGERGESAL